MSISFSSYHTSLALPCGRLRGEHARQPDSGQIGTSRSHVTRSDNLVCVAPFSSGRGVGCTLPPLLNSTPVMTLYIDRHLHMHPAHLHIPPSRKVSVFRSNNQEKNQTMFHHSSIDESLHAKMVATGFQETRRSPQ